MTEATHESHFDETENDNVGVLDSISISSIARFALRLWLTYFASALIASVVANGIFGIAFGSVVDVLFSLQLTFVLFAIGLLVLLVVLNFAWREFRDFWIFLVLAFVYALVLFAASGGYMIYAYLTGSHLSQVSFVYAGFVAALQDILHVISSVGSAVSLPHMESIVRPQYLNLIQTIASVGSFLITAITSLFGQQSRA